MLFEQVDFISISFVEFNLIVYYQLFLDIFMILTFIDLNDLNTIDKDKHTKIAASIFIILHLYYLIIFIDIILYIFYYLNMSSTGSIKYQILTFPYFQQARKLIAKEFPTNNIITSGLDIPFSEFRYDNLKFQQNSGLIAIEVKSDRVVGVVLTQDFLTFIQQNQKPITYSQFFEFYRKTFLVPFIKDYLQRYPNLKRGEFSYSYRACIDAQFSNQAIFKGIFMQLHQFNKKRGYKFQIGITHDPKIIRTLDPNRMILTEYKVQNPIFKGKHIRVALNVEPISKL